MLVLDQSHCLIAAYDTAFQQQTSWLYAFMQFYVYAVHGHNGVRAMPMGRPAGPRGGDLAREPAHVLDRGCAQVPSPPLLCMPGDAKLPPCKPYFA